jgi:signal transduction histidine kinase
MKDIPAGPKTVALSMDVYGDPRKISRIFNRFIVLIIVGFAAGIVFEISNENFLAAALVGIFLIPVLTSLYFIHRRQFEMTAIILAVILISLITVVATTGQGIRQVSVLAYPAVLIVASLVIRKRIMVFLTLYNIGCVAWLIFGELSGVYSPDRPSYTTPGEFFIAAIVLGFTAVMVRLLTEILFQNNLHLQKELQERKLVEEQREVLIRELEARNAELERITYTVSHDLRSPLVTMKGYLGYLEMDALNGNTKRFQSDLNRISYAADRMDRLLKDLLELSRVGRFVNPPESIHFEELVNQALELTREQIKESNAIVDVQPDLPAVHVDRHSLVEVLLNLIENAVKHAGTQSQPRIEIGLGGYDQPSGNPIFFVRDNGTGIDPKYHEYVFGLFNKMDPQTDGTGVGLTLVKSIIEFHEGRIWIESEAEKGTTICFTLPRT